jgi:NADP-reducing hydrogenase subunit HndB
MLKNAADLEKMRKKVKASLAARQSAGCAQLVVSMGTCGIAAGARETVSSLLEEAENQKIQNITITQSGCKGLCDREPMLTVIKPGEKPVTYGDVTPETARRILTEHVKGGKIVEQFVVFTGETEGAKDE